jgi:hypothetical protein
VAVAQDLPGEVLVQWSYRPAAWESTATLTLQGPDGDGWSLTWGGADEEGRPRGVIELRDGAGELLATGADVVYYRGDFRGGYGNFRGPDEPREQTWYDFTLLLREDTLYLLLTGSTARVPVPVIVWNTRHDAAAGPLELALTQEGTGWWRGLGVWAMEYTADQPPPAPGAVQARAHGGGRVALTWETVSGAPEDYLFEVHRSPQAGFTPSAETVVAAEVRGGGWNDFSVEPQATYHYAVRTLNALGRTSEFARTEAQTGVGGPQYTILRASDVDEVRPPMVLAEAAPDQRAQSFLWASGAAYATESAPEEGLARFHFTVEEAGTYALWGLVFAPSGGANSFWAAVDEGQFALWHTAIHTRWRWNEIPLRAELEAGEHDLHVKHREPATRLGAILITDDLEWTPGRR